MTNKSFDADVFFDSPSRLDFVSEMLTGPSSTPTVTREETNPSQAIEGDEKSHNGSPSCSESDN